MRRVLATAGCDARVQLRAGFYYAALFVMAFWALGRAAAPELGQAWLVPALMLNTLAVTAFYFAAGLVLLERIQGTRLAQWVTPLSAGEYLGGKLLTLGALALVQALTAALLLAGPGFAPLPLLLGAGLAAAALTLAGVVAAVRYDSINTFLVPSGLVIGALMMPLVPYALGWDSWPIYLHPLQPALVLMRAALEPADPQLLAYACVYGGLWLAALYWLALRALSRRGV